MPPPSSAAAVAALPRSCSTATASPPMP
uniref:Uncharacterized protein n=1 Tax=Arundo donax TaxID=35708 RepID=A0A0A9FJF2_ARUDO